VLRRIDVGNNAGSFDPRRLWFVEDQRLGRKEPLDTETGECGERRLNHSRGATRAGSSGYRQHRGMDRGCGEDQDQASSQAEDRSQRRSITVEAATRKELSAHLGTQSGESGSPAAALWWWFQNSGRMVGSYGLKSREVNALMIGN
jgi:hypothetical protein